jgi:flagellar motor switch protein FliN/FliY
MNPFHPILRSPDAPQQPGDGAPAPKDAAPDPQDALESAKQSVEEIAREATSTSEEAETPALDLPEFRAELTEHPVSGIDLLSKVNLNVRIELGRTRMLVEDVLRLNQGSVVELDKLAGDPVDVYVNDRHVACGEVLVLNDTFCVRISEIFSRGDEGGDN